MNNQPNLSDPQSYPQPQTEPDSSPSDLSIPSNWNYEATVAEVEAIIQHIEIGDLPLADLFSQFEIAVERLRQCETFLNRQQQQVDLLIETLLDESELF